MEPFRIHLTHENKRFLFVVQSPLTSTISSLYPQIKHIYSKLYPDSSPLNTFFLKDENGSQIWNEYVVSDAIDRNARLTVVENGNPNLLLDYFGEKSENLNIELVRQTPHNGRDELVRRKLFGDENENENPIKKQRVGNVEPQNQKDKPFLQRLQFFEENLVDKKSPPKKGESDDDDDDDESSSESEEGDSFEQNTKTKENFDFETDQSEKSKKDEAVVDKKPRETKLVEGSNPNPNEKKREEKKLTKESDLEAEKKVEKKEKSENGKKEKHSEKETHPKQEKNQAKRKKL